MKGICFTRDINYAMEWGSVVIAIDQRVLSQRTKIVPYSWGSSIPYPNINVKKDREEFAIVSMKRDTYKFPADHDAAGERDMKRFLEPGGTIPLTPILRQIWLDVSLATTRSPKNPTYPRKKTWEDYELEEKDSYEVVQMKNAGFTIEQVITHPLFCGYYEQDGKTIRRFSPDTPRNQLPPSHY